MQQSSYDGCLVKNVVTKAWQDQQKSAGVEGPLGAKGPRSQAESGGRQSGGRQAGGRQPGQRAEKSEHLFSTVGIE